MKRMILCAIAIGAVAFVASANETGAQGLDGLFGVKFGKVMRATEACDTNNVGELAYEYTPEKMFKGYTDYILFATPITRQVSQVRAVARVGRDEVDDEMESTVRVLKMKFNRKAQVIDENTEAIFFDNGDYIAITKDGRRLVIDACCKRLRDLTKEEVAKAEKERYSGDVKILALLPGKEDGDDRIYKMDSVFGVRFGEKFKGLDEGEKNRSGAWVYEFKPRRLFMECENYLAFATETTKAVFMVRAVYQGNEYSARYDQIRRVIESVTGRKMRTSDDKDRNENELRMQFGDCLITLEKNTTYDKVILDFVRINLYLQNEKEHKATAQKAVKSDLDAL